MKPAYFCVGSFGAPNAVPRSSDAQLLTWEIMVRNSIFWEMMAAMAPLSKTRIDMWYLNIDILTQYYNIL